MNPPKSPTASPASAHNPPRHLAHHRLAYPIPSPLAQLAQLDQSTQVPGTSGAIAQPDSPRRYLTGETF
ncbi:hypothetical protein CSOJ01_13774 [Colletotrichum sojae]|uniref:Uncharacterized protein n=1 Tax=Colletotrichum sojae TaxID=2175907 RepID=A0A8H6IRY0_9PEZI|nr:hypothetical protein CSOJ01_13774 [Colletotrichum sojae]